MPDRTPCPACKGKGTVQMCMNPEAPEGKQEFMNISCRMCGGTGYAAGSIPTKTPEEIAQEEYERKLEAANHVDRPPAAESIPGQEAKAAIIDVVIKYPQLLINDGAEFDLGKHPAELFLFLQFQNIFSLAYSGSKVKVSLKPEYRNKTAVETILYLKNVPSSKPRK